MVDICKKCKKKIENDFNKLISEKGKIEHLDCNQKEWEKSINSKNEL